MQAFSRSSYRPHDLNPTVRILFCNSVCTCLDSHRSRSYLFLCTAAPVIDLSAVTSTLQALPLEVSMRFDELHVQVGNTHHNTLTDCLCPAGFCAVSTPQSGQFCPQHAAKSSRTGLLGLNYNTIMVCSLQPIIRCHCSPL
jgi:hypothetical protein